MCSTIRARNGGISDASSAAPTEDEFSTKPEEHATIAQVPSSLPEVLDSLEKSHDFLTEGDVFTADLIEEWIDYKRTHEIGEQTRAACTGSGTPRGIGFRL